MVRTRARLQGRDVAGALAGAVITFCVLACLAAPLYSSEVAGTSASDNHLSEQVVIDGVPTDVVSLSGIPIGPTWQKEFLLGADENGRDLMVRLLYGGRTTFVIAIGAVILTVAIAVPLALVAGYFRGKADSVISRILDQLWSFPALLLGVLIGTALTARGFDVSPFKVSSSSALVPILVIGIVYVPYMARPLRSHVLSLRGEAFAEAARAAGFSNRRIMFSELLPHLVPSMLVLGMLSLVNAVVLESALSFLGAGVDPPEPSVGSLIAAGLDTVLLSPHLLLVPCCALVLVVLSLSVLAERLRDALDPRGRISRSDAVIR